MQTPNRRLRSAADRIATTERLLLLDPENLNELLRFYARTRAQDWNLTRKLSQLADGLREEMWVVEGALTALANRRAAQPTTGTTAEDLSAFRSPPSVNRAAGLPPPQATEQASRTSPPPL